MDDLTGLMGTEWECAACGEPHRLNVRETIVGSGALMQLPGVVARHSGSRHVAVLSDERTHVAAGRRVLSLLQGAGLQVDSFVLTNPDAEGHGPVCDDTTHAQLSAELPEAPCYIAVGSGVVSDLTKWAAFDRNAPYIAVATAASMNGYASDNVAPTLRGVKTLLHGRGPVAVVGDLDVLREAPHEMTAAGLGDVLAKSVSTVDWHLNRLLFGEFFCPFCAGLIDGIEPIYMGAPEDIGEHTVAGIEALFQALIYTGFAMSIAGTSAPASGGEHLVSHTLDMMALRDGVEHDLHGRQVGVGTILGAALYGEIAAVEEATFVPPEEKATDRAFWGRFTEVVEEKHAGKRERARMAAAKMASAPELWESIRTDLAATVHAPEVVKDCLRRAGAAHRLRDIGVTRERILDVLSHCHEIRERFTVLDLARITGILPARAEELVDRWLSE